MNVCTRTTTQIYAIVQCNLCLYYWSLQISTCWQYHKKCYKVTLQNELKSQVFTSWLGNGKCHPCQLIPVELLLQILEDSHCKTWVTLHHLYQGENPHHRHIINYLQGVSYEVPWFTYWPSFPPLYLMVLRALVFACWRWLSGGHACSYAAHSHYQTSSDQHLCNNKLFLRQDYGYRSSILN